MLSDYTLRANLHDAVRDAFEPLLIFIGGEPANFTSKDHAFYAGEKFSKSVVAVNDRTSPQTVSFKWKLRLDGEPLPAASGEFEKTVEPEAWKNSRFRSSPQESPSALTRFCRSKPSRTGL